MSGRFLPATSPAGAVVPDQLPLVVEHASVAYGRTKVINDVSIQLQPNSVTAMLGPNGAGKTTLLKAITGLQPLSGGRVLLHGENITRMSLHRRSRVGLCHVPEGRGIYRSLSVKENLRMQAPPGTETTAIEKAVSTFPVLGKRLTQAAGTMSGGEQQMLAMAAAYVRDPRVIVVDELSLGLAPVIINQLYEFLGVLASQGVCLLLVDQYATRALALADTVYVLRKGQIAYQGAAQDLAVDELFEHYVGASDGGDTPTSVTPDVQE